MIDKVNEAIYQLKEQGFYPNLILADKNYLSLYCELLSLPNNATTILSEPKYFTYRGIMVRKTERTVTGLIEVGHDIYVMDTNNYFRSPKSAIRITPD